MNVYRKETTKVRRRLHRAYRQRVKASLRRGEEPPRWRRTSGWVSW